ncbi:ParB/RepB/Spo0J family partition protein [Arthrobacter sp. MI7-26]|uniref:ParB/RepB/Spo0J family partition protein n=1 Tax=Arthrobacter sp. MI7-26 TaxID=2993653 RepID=UPI0022490C9B|nr:ParB/RepB/Spo0J family partition protein [Arthrobacter sp. MI7-26]MCX2747278.1 ParB/RepB/Spo0J family partition protein [Arthrobacter sp. MI7-26]
MSEKRRGLGRGLGALIPSSASAGASGNGVPASRPVDLFFPEARKAPETVDSPQVLETEVAKSSPSRGSSSKSSTAAKTPAAKSLSAEISVTSKPAAAEAASSDAAGDAVSETLPVDAPKVELVEVPGARFAEIPVGDIHPNRKQPRSVFDEDDMAELVHSVKEIGVLQPIVVRTSTEKGGEPYELVMGERRWRAVQAAGLETIPAIVRDTNDDDLLRDALLENLHRSQLNPLEEAAAYQQLLEDFGTTHEQLADRIGRSRPQVSNTIRLLKLPPLVQRRVAASVLSAGHARALLALPDAAAMERLAQKIVAEGMSVRATEEAVALYQDPTVPPKNSIPRPNARHERLDYLASSLSDRLDTNVKITLGARKGRVSIEFASVEDLNRIMDVLSPDAEG